MREQPENVFPLVIKDGGSMVVLGGLSLLDYFAAQVLPACTAYGGNHQTQAAHAYRLALAMMEERKKHLPQEKEKTG